MNNQIIPIFIPHVGCPHDCVFCNQLKITNHKETIDRKKNIEYIKKYLQYFKSSVSPKEIAFYGGSFTGIPRGMMIEYLEIADYFIKKGVVDRIRCSTRPDYINEEILVTLKKYHVKTIELGVQSMSDRILRLNGRNHSSLDVECASTLIKSKKFALGLQMMTNLYGATHKDDMETCQKIIQLQPDFTRIYPTLVIKDTNLEALYHAGKYHPRTVDDEVNHLIDLVKEFKKAQIPIIRIGLQPTENINVGKDVVVGPFHASLRQLVEERIYRELVERYIKTAFIRQLEIGAPKEIINYFIGNRASNKKYFIKKHGLQKIIFKQCDKIRIKVDGRTCLVDPCIT